MPKRRSRRRYAILACTSLAAGEADEAQADQERAAKLEKKLRQQEMQLFEAEMAEEKVSNKAFESVEDLEDDFW